MQWFQAPGQILAPDQLTTGQGRLTLGQSRAEIFLYAALSAPMFLSCRLATLAAQPELLALLRLLLRLLLPAPSPLPTLQSQLQRYQ